MRILIVEDTDIKYDQIERAINKLDNPDIEIMRASCINEGKVEVTSNKYDLVFMDMVMPRYNEPMSSKSLTGGIEVLQYMLKRDKDGINKDTEVIFTSSEEVQSKLALHNLTGYKSIICSSMYAWTSTITDTVRERFHKLNNHEVIDDQNESW